MEGEKPFACTLPGCEMKFVNEERLAVHREKHELSLTLTPNSGIKALFTDEGTPTPSRFLIGNLDADLFSDVNPFDVHFRRANSLVAATGEIPTISEQNTSSESLNTPIVLPVEDPILPSVDSKFVTALRRQNSKTTGNTLEIPLKIPKLNSNDGSNLKEDPEKNKTSLSVSVNQILNNRNAVVQTPVITSVGNFAKLSTPSVPKTVIVTRASMNNAPNLNSSVTQLPVMTDANHSVITTNVSQTNQVPLTSVLQLVIRLPDGQSMPVALPLAVAPTTTVPTVSKNIIPNHIKPNPPITHKSLTQSTVKKKLKEVLKVESTPSSGVLLSGRAPLDGGSDDYSPLFLSTQESESPPSSPHHVGRPGVNGRRRRTLDDADERRKKSLERNRAAATRCRQKRKQWISSLELKQTEMAQKNADLQNEVNSLRNEVAYLKTMLLAHKDCPVTQLQKASGLNENVNVSSHVSIIPKILLPSVEHDLSTENVTSEPIVQLMECENSSSQSGYISENSEISTRER